MSVMIRTVTRKLLKHAAGAAIFCPVCQSIMDWRRTVILEINTVDGTNLKVFVACAACADKRLPDLREKCTERGLVLEVTDGREFKR